MLTEADIDVGIELNQLLPAMLSEALRRLKNEILFSPTESIYAPTPKIFHNGPYALATGTRACARQC